MDSDIKLGSLNTKGIYVNDTQLLQFDITKLLGNIEIASDYALNYSTNNFVLIANLSTSVEIDLVRGNNVTTIPKQHIEWYNINLNEYYPLEIINNGNKLVRCYTSEKVIRKDSNVPITNFAQLTADNGDSVIYIQKNSDDSDFKNYFAVVIIFDKI